jgi:hypothetical protein
VSIEQCRELCDVCLLVICYFRKKIGAVACFKDAYIVTKLPKTRSGKVSEQVSLCEI